MQEQEINMRYEYYQCSRVPNIRTVYISLLFLVYGVLLGSALFMAFKTRKIQIKGLNDAKYITAIVYISSLTLVIYIVIYFAFGHRVNTFPGVAMGIILVTATVIQGLVYIPKVHLSI